MQPDWKEFEDLAASIQRELAPEATVTTNAKLPGRRSQAERQVDILVEQRVGQFDLRIAIDCKDHKDPVDVKDVEAVIGLIDDVAVNKGAIIAANGFTPAAKKRGTDAGLDLYRLIDAANHKWRSYVTIPAVTKDCRLGKCNFKIQFTRYGAVEERDLQHMSVIRADGSLIDYGRNLVLDRWEDKSIPHSPGDYHDLPLVSESTFLRSSRGPLPVRITFNINVFEVIHFGQLPLSEIRGFCDEVKDGMITTGFTTGDFNFETIGRQWQQIASIKQLAVKPMIALTVSSKYPRYNPAITDEGNG